MNHTLLLLSAILAWIAVLVGTYQRVFEMPKWFADPPASFELIRRQAKTARMFWIPLSALFMICVCTALVMNWSDEKARWHVMAGIACFGLTGALSGMYFVKEVIAFTKIPVDAPRSEELTARTRTWLRWTTIRDVLQFLAAVFITFGYLHRIQ
jgi:hypothetical protein